MLFAQVCPFLTGFNKAGIKKEETRHFSASVPFRSISDTKKKKTKNETRMESIFILHKPETVVQSNEAAEGRHEAREP